MNVRTILITLVVIAACTAVFDMLILSGFGASPDAGQVTQVTTSDR